MLNGQKIELTTTVKFLGLHIDRGLRWKEQLAAAGSSTGEGARLVREMQ
jgi:hypothetical protein